MQEGGRGGGAGAWLTLVLYISIEHVPIEDKGLLVSLTRMTAKLERWSQAHITSVCVSLTRRHPDVDHLPLTPDGRRWGVSVYKGQWG